MTELPLERIGPYVRALQAGLDALAPHDDHVPLGAGLAHLQALDPALSGSLLLPAEVSTATGMPSFTWMQRALSEQVLARQRAEALDASDDALDDATSLDLDLGRRMRDRRTLHRHLRGADLLRPTALSGAVRRLGRSADPARGEAPRAGSPRPVGRPSGECEFAVRYDRLAPDGRWLRIRFDVGVPAPRRQAGPLRATIDGRIEIDDALQHLVTRHFLTPLLALRAQIEAATEAVVLRVSRSMIGPFWFPDVTLPDGIPAVLGSGLLLHTSTEVVATDVHASRHLDPWLPPPADEVVPTGHQVFRERRFAASPGLVAAVMEWAAGRGVTAVVVPLGAPRRRRL